MLAKVLLELPSFHEATVRVSNSLSSAVGPPASSSSGVSRVSSASSTLERASSRVGPFADRARDLGDLGCDPAFASIGVADRQMNLIAHGPNGSRSGGEVPDSVLVLALPPGQRLDRHRAGKAPLSTFELCTQLRTLSPMSQTVPVREFRSNLARLLSDVADRRDHVLVTRNGKPAAALVPVDEYDALEETAEILSDPEAIAALEEGLAELERGEQVDLSELRVELAERRDR